MYIAFSLTQGVKDKNEKSFFGSIYLFGTGACGWIRKFTVASDLLAFIIRDRDWFLAGTIES